MRSPGPCLHTEPTNEGIIRTCYTTYLFITNALETTADASKMPIHKKLEVTVNRITGCPLTN